MSSTSSLNNVMAAVDLYKVGGIVGGTVGSAYVMKALGSRLPTALVIQGMLIANAAGFALLHLSAGSQYAASLSDYGLAGGAGAFLYNYEAAKLGLGPSVTQIGLAGVLTAGSFYFGEKLGDYMKGVMSPSKP